MAFDQNDYKANPNKYRMFSSAVIAKNIVTHNGEQDMEEGQIVGIEFLCEARNQLFRRDEPVYKIKGTDINLYANCLRDFVI